MRLFQRGDVGIDFVACKLLGKPTWQEIAIPVNLKVPMSGYLEPYDLKNKDSLALLSFADQLDLVLDSIEDNRIKVASENFMTSYSRNPVDRLEGYMRTLQALFMRRGDPMPKLSERVSKFLARNEEQLALVEKTVRNSYALRSRVSHGNLAPSELEQSAIKKIPPVEQYCRESIYFFISLARIGKLDYTLIKLDCKLDPKEMAEIRRKANQAFWLNRRIISKTRDEVEVFLQLWPD